MPASRKQTTGVRENKKHTASRTRLAGSRSGPAAKKQRPKKAAADAAAPELNAAGRTGKSQSTLAESLHEPETPQVGSAVEHGDIEMEGHADVSEETASILSIVKGLAEQVDTAFELKEALETDLDATHKRLSNELAVRVELEGRVDSLEAQAALAEQLRQDIAFAEEERNKFAGLVAEIQPRLEAVTEERTSLAEELTSTKAQAREFENEKTTFEAQVMNLRDKVADMDRMQGQLAEAIDARRDSDQQMLDLSSRLESCDTSKNALETELAGARETVGSQREELQELREKLTGTEGLAGDLRVQLQQEQAANRDLMEIRTRLESETKTSAVNHEATRKELDAAKKALRDIRGEATRASGRVRQRYFKPKDSK